MLPGIYQMRPTKSVLIRTSRNFLVLDLQKQLYQFLHHRAAVTEKHGQAYAEEKFADAVYLISIGSNDYLGGYFGNPQQREKFTPEQFVHAIVTGIVEGIKVLYSSGARKIVVFGLGPMGCLPALRALEETGSCSAPVSALAVGHNEAMKGALSQMQQFLPRLTIVQAHFYEFFSERLQHPSNYGYVSGDQPCCGAGPCEGRCGVHELHPKKPGCEPCSNANAYVWWDPFHPSETVHRQFAEIIWNGTLAHVQPVPLQELFQPQKRKENSYADNLDLFAGDPMQQLVSETILMS